MADNVTRLNDNSTADPCGAPPRGNSKASSDVIVNDLGAHCHTQNWTPHACPNSPPHVATTISGTSVVIINDLQCTRIGDPISCGSTIVEGSDNVFAGTTASGPVGGVVLPINQNSPINAAALILELGTAAIDDEFETNDGIDVYPPVEQTAPPGPITEDPVAEDDARPEDVVAPATDCSMIVVPVDYSLQLSSHFKLEDLSVKAFFPHAIKAQNGLSLAQVACNLKALAENVLEAIWNQYPGFRINSAFRTRQNGRSQHEKGQAADLQWPGISYDEYWTRINWIKNNINFDQLLFEHGNSPWVHVSFNQAGNRPKSAANAVMTMYRNKFSPGLKKMQ